MLRIQNVKCSGFSRNAFADYMSQSRIYSVRLNPAINLYGDNLRALGAVHNRISAFASKQGVNMERLSSLKPVERSVLFRPPSEIKQIKMFPFGMQTDYLFSTSLKKDPTAWFTEELGGNHRLSAEKFNDLKRKKLYPKGFSPEWLMSPEARTFFGMMTEEEILLPATPKKATLDQIEESSISHLILPPSDRGRFMKENS